MNNKLEERDEAVNSGQVESLKSLIDGCLSALEKNNLDQQKNLKNYSFNKKFTFDLSDSPTATLGKFLNHMPCCVSDFSSNIKLQNILIEICNSCFKMQKNLPVDVFLTYGKLDNSPLFMQKCEITRNALTKEYVFQLDSKITIGSACSQLLNIKPSGRTIESKGLFKASDAIDSFNDNLNALHPNKKYTIDDTRLITILLDEPSTPISLFKSNYKSMMNSKFLRSISGDRKSLNDIRIGNSSGIEALLREYKFLQVPDTAPEEEFGVGDLSNEQRLVLKAFDSGISFNLENSFEFENSRFIASFMAHSACKNQKTVHITDQKNGNSSSVASVRKFLHEDGLRNLHLDLTQRSHFDEKISAQVSNTKKNPKLTLSDIDAQNTSKLNEARQNITQKFENLSTLITPWNISFSEIALSITRNAFLPNFDTVLSRDSCFNIAGKSDIYCAEINKLLELDNSLSSDSQSFGKVDTNEINESLNWRFAAINNQEQIDYINQNIDKIINTLLPTLQQYIDEISDTLKIDRPKSLSQWNEYASLFVGILKSQDLFIRDVFENDLDPYLNALSQKDQALGKSQKNGHKVSFFEKNHLIKEVKELFRPGKNTNLSNSDIYHELELVNEQKRQWLLLLDSSSNQDLNELPDVIASKCIVNLPVCTPKALSISELLNTELSRFDELFKGHFSNNVDFDIDSLVDFSLDSLSEIFTHLNSQRFILDSILDRNAILTNLSSIGMKDFALELISKRVNIKTTAEALDKVWHSSIFSHIIDAHPELNFSAYELQKLIYDFSTLDSIHAHNLSQPVKVLADQYRAEKLNSLKFDFNNINDIDEESFMKEFYFAYSLSLSNIGLIEKLYPDNEQIDILIIENSDTIDVDYLLPIISKTRQIIFLSNANNTNISPRSCLSIFHKAVPTIDFDSCSTFVPKRDLRISKTIMDLSSTLHQGIEIESSQNMVIPINVNMNLISSETDVISKIRDYIRRNSNQMGGRVNVIGDTISVINFKKELQLQLKSDQFFKESLVKFELNDNCSLSISTPREISFRGDLTILLLDDNFGSISTLDYERFLKSIDGELCICFDDNFKSTKSIQIKDFFLNCINSDKLSLDQAQDLFSDVNKADSSIDKFDSPKTNELLESISNTLQKDGYETFKDYKLTSEYLAFPLVVSKSNPFPRNGEVSSREKYRKVVVTFDIDDYLSSKSLREVFRFRQSHYEKLGWSWVQLSTVGLINNPRLEIARIKDAFLSDTARVPAKSRSASSVLAQKSDQIDQRGREMLENKPPHWG
jgi:hypothetical protein